MCFYDSYVMACGCEKWGHFRRHCSKEYRTGETCGMKLVMNRYQSTENCKICTKIDVKERSIRKAEEELGRIRFGQPEQRKKEQYISPTGETREDRKLQDDYAKEEARIQEMKMESRRSTRYVTKHGRQKSDFGICFCFFVTDSSKYFKVENPNSRVVIPYRFTSNGTKAHPAIDLSCQQIRLFELTSITGASTIEGAFRLVSLSASVTYAALSYTWGNPDENKLIQVGGKRLAIPQNLWWFLHSWDSSKIEKPNLFWIDAICINQANLLERNHQVGLMKQIYRNAMRVILWLGQEANNSDLAMEFMATKGSVPLKRKGYGFRKLWTRDEGKALLVLCERGYWMCIWIIQEIIHARQITVLCGKKSFEWNSFENLYGKLKTLELRSWILHHEYAAVILYSSASVMVWQRAHWRHPETSAPRLRTLLETFEDWQCSDIRDKVYGLLGLVGQDAAVVVDYSKSAEELYDELRTQGLGYKLIIGNDYLWFCRLFRRVLKLAEYR
ncbi:hypothetical protein DL98DRAFT_655500 [Cadophora sp. DSE1049]|nr:hypothetical protein DL98DRAFT_655500 [Cadophora sp. DSE1049]